MDEPRITIDDLKRRMDAHEPLMLLDSRSAVAWESSDVEIPRSVRVPPDEVDKHLSQIPRDRLVVPYCT
jgi:rhodanese-related sulfurtransferase